MIIWQVRYFDRTGGRFLPEGLGFWAGRFPNAAAAREGAEGMLALLAAHPDCAGEGFDDAPLFWDIQDDERWSYIASGGLVGEVFADEIEVGVAFYGLRGEAQRHLAVELLREACRDIGGGEIFAGGLCG